LASAAVRASRSNSLLSCQSAPQVLSPVHQASSAAALSVATRRAATRDSPERRQFGGDPFMQDQ
jgi:hypothetical protein